MPCLGMTLAHHERGWDALLKKVRLFLKTDELILTQGTLPKYLGVVIQFAKAAESMRQWTIEILGYV